MTAGNQTLRGGRGADFYFVGGNSGDDYHRRQGSRRRRRTALHGCAVERRQGDPRRPGPDPADRAAAPTSIRLTDQFLGELNDLLSNGKRVDTGVNAIVFADGVVWDRFRMAMEVVDKERAAGLFNDGSDRAPARPTSCGAARATMCCTAAPAATSMSSRPATARTSSTRTATFSFGPVKAGIDILRFGGGITARQSQARSATARARTCRSTCSTTSGNSPATASMSEVAGSVGGAAQSRAFGASDPGLDGHLCLAEPDRALRLRRRQLARFRRDRRRRCWRTRKTAATTRSTACSTTTRSTAGRATTT